MGREGIAFTFVVPGEGDILTSIEQRINRELIKDSIEGFETSGAAPSRAAVEAAVLAKEALTEPVPIPRRLNPMNRPSRGRRR
jgi:ATP-dependent RNA helicase DeaD